jgi:hypothetical protein
MNARGVALPLAVMRLGSCEQSGAGPGAAGSPVAPPVPLCAEGAAGTRGDAAFPDFSAARPRAFWAGLVRRAPVAGALR